MFKIDYNPITKRLEERSRNLSQEQLDAIEHRFDHMDNLKLIKRTRREKKDGDIFLCTVNGSVYYYGKILQAKIENPTNSWINGCLLICIFRDKTTEKNLKNFRGDYNNLLTNPRIITSQYWSMGWFETIGNVPLTEEDRNLDYGFWNKEFIGPMGWFCKADGTVMDHIPKYFDVYGVTTFTGVYHDIALEIIIDPSLLDAD